MKNFRCIGVQHRPLLPQYLASVEKQINKKYGNQTEFDGPLLLNVIKENNKKQLEQDLAKLLMSMKQSFVDIIV
jgi:hypothetical protein